MDGIININKPSGITSFDVVRTIRKIARTKKVGHTGTLDPEASGVLPVCIGKGTKVVDFIMNNNKVYEAILKLGVTTDTFDNTGTIIRTSEVNRSNDEINSAINKFVGRIQQIPPMYSAIKVHGKKLYELAREGIIIDRKPREITINSIDILSMDIPYVSMKINCSKGTYIRSLCNDIGDELCCGGIMWALKRTATGIFTIDNSVNLDDLDENNIQNFIIPVDEALKNYQYITFKDCFKKQLLNGVVLTDKNVLQSISENILYRVYTEDKSFIGLGQKNNIGFKIVKLLI